MRKLYSFFVVAIATLLPSLAPAQGTATIESVCANYRWDTLGPDGSDVSFNIAIKQDKTENGIVISGVFSKYELKATFDPSTGEISIENQRVGFDAQNNRFLSFEHHANEGDVDPAPLVLVDDGDGIPYAYEEYGVVAESMDSEYLTAEGMIEYGQFAFLYRTGDLENTDWEEAGVATLFDGGFFTPLPRVGIGFKTPVEVVLEKSTTTENLYRLVKPWDSYFGKEMAQYLEFDISDPECVIIPTQATGFVDEEYGAASVQNFVGMYIAAGFGVEDAMAVISEDKKSEYLCTYDDAKKVITMPVNSTFTTFAGDENYWNVGRPYGASDSYIVMPGGSSSGIVVVSTADDKAPVEYFNLQGIRVDKPASGQIVIRRQGGKTSKVAM